jgi:hypothetical protein
MSLRDAIRHILSPHPAPAESAAYIDLTLRIALIHLLKRIKAGTINPSFFGLTPDDLALDCLAPLFARDAHGRFMHLETYYTALHWETLPDPDLLACTRRLVFSTVHQQLVRLYRDHDPSLEKIIRNLRNALRGHATLEEERRGNELWIRSTGETTDHRLLPEMPWVFLEGELTGYLHDRTPLRAIVQHVAAILSAQTIYRRSVPLTSLALILRMAYSRFEQEPADEGVVEEAILRPDEAEHLIRDALDNIEAEKRGTYVGKGKVTVLTYAAYFAAIRSILRAEFVENDGMDRSFHEQLQTHLPGLSADEYKEHHRCHLEYLAKLARERLLERIRKELSGGNGKAPAGVR